MVASQNAADGVVVSAANGQPNGGAYGGFGQGSGGAAPAAGVLASAGVASHSSVGALGVDRNTSLGPATPVVTVDVPLTAQAG